MNLNWFMQACCLGLLWCATMHGNMIWPAIYISGAIWGLSYLVIVSVLIEAAIFYLWLHIKPFKALLVAVIGNCVSFFIGTWVMSVAMLGWHFIADRFFGGTFNIPNYVISFILLYLGTCLIELFVVKLLLRNYTFRQLAPAVFIGNLVTYLLVLVYNYETIMQLLQDLKTSY